jgi:diguanylate cyclase (GGDEF)-like protein
MGAITSAPCWAGSKKLRARPAVVSSRSRRSRPARPTSTCPSRPRIQHRVAWDHIDAFVVILNAADNDYLGAARAAGKPVVVISDDRPGLSCPIVLPHNGVGTREAVAHLVAHGHRDIAFAGHPVTRDFRERYETYQATLRESGIEPRPELFFETGSSQESGGERAAAAMIAAGMPSTAVLCGNDLNAVGLMRTLTAAGYDLPRQQAVVGFDDMVTAVFLTPSLSTVHQPFHRIGELAGQLALRQLAGEEVANTSHYVATSFIARQSCDCADPLTLAAKPADSGPDVTGYEPIRHLLTAAARGGPGPEPHALRNTLLEVSANRRRPEDLVDFMRGVRHLGHQIAAGEPDSGAAVRVAEVVQEVVLALTEDHVRDWFHAGQTYQEALNAQYTVCMYLLRTHEKDPRALEWILDTDVRAGCLGLWARTATANRPPVLTIAASVEQNGPSRRDTRVCPAEAFPPAEFVEMADIDHDEMLYVAPTKVGGSDWGMLAIVGPIDAHRTASRGMMNQWTALLTIALDHEAVLERLREREEQLQYAALYDSLTELPNRALFHQRLNSCIARGEEPGHRYAVLLLDLDGFKLVNDSMGHLAGDRLLVQVAERIGRCLRADDLAARLGGDEFAILLERIDDVYSPVAVAERIRDALRQPFPVGRRGGGDLGQCRDRAGAGRLPAGRGHHPRRGHGHVRGEGQRQGHPLHLRHRDAHHGRTTAAYRG